LGWAPSATPGIGPRLDDRDDIGEQADEYEVNRDLGEELGRLTKRGPLLALLGRGHQNHVRETASRGARSDCSAGAEGFIVGALKRGSFGLFEAGEG
jgi:hypothetical protein